MTMDIKAQMKKLSDEMDAPIKSYIKDEAPANLIEASRQYPYAGGKRMRPTMVVAACGAVGGDKKKAVPLGVAIEYIHNFTLVHDDLMDGDEMRRGMVTSHVKYGMATAILAGDALFAKAFDIISELDVPDDILRKIIKIVTVCNNNNSRRINCMLQKMSIEDHRKRFTRTLSMPEYTDFSIATYCKFCAFNSLAYCKILMISRKNLIGINSVIIKTYNA